MIDRHPVLRWREGFYSEAFIILHPFRDLRPLAEPARRYLASRNIEDGGYPVGALFRTWWSRVLSDREQTEIYETATVMESEHGIAVEWKEVCAKCGFHTPAPLLRALKTKVRALKVEFEDSAAATRLDAFLERAGIYVPDDDPFPTLLRNSLLDVFFEAGVDALDTARDHEPDDNYVRATLEESRDVTKWLGRASRIAAPDRSLVVKSIFDGFHSIIYGRGNLQTLRISDRFEGFWCSEATDYGWEFDTEEKFRGWTA